MVMLSTLYLRQKKGKQILVSPDFKLDACPTLVDEAPPLPGLVIRREILDRFRIAQADLAHLTGVSPARVSVVLTGKNPIPSELALRLAEVTATDPAHWIDVQSKFNYFQNS